MQVGSMDTIVGRVIRVDRSGRSFTVVSTTHGRGGAITTKKHTVNLGRETAFISKGKRKVKSSAAKLRPGVDIIARLGPSSSGEGLRAYEVWHQTTSGGAVYLTAAECKNLGGTVETDTDCGFEKRCKTAGGSMCIDEVS